MMPSQQQADEWAVREVPYVVAGGFALDIIEVVQAMQMIGLSKLKYIQQATHAILLALQEAKFTPQLRLAVLQTLDCRAVIPVS